LRLLVENLVVFVYIVIVWMLKELSREIYTTPEIPCSQTIDNAIRTLSF